MHNSKQERDETKKAIDEHQRQIKALLTKIQQFGKYKPNSNTNTNTNDATSTSHPIYQLPDEAGNFLGRNLGSSFRMLLYYSTHLAASIHSNNNNNNNNNSKNKTSVNTTTSSEHVTVLEWRALGKDIIHLFLNPEMGTTTSTTSAANLYTVNASILHHFFSSLLSTATSTGFDNNTDCNLILLQWCLNFILQTESSLLLSNNNIQSSSQSLTMMTNPSHHPITFTNTSLLSTPIHMVLKYFIHSMYNHNNSTHIKDYQNQLHSTNTTTKDNYLSFYSTSSLLSRLYHSSKLDATKACIIREYLSVIFQPILLSTSTPTPSSASPLVYNNNKATFHQDHSHYVQSILIPSLSQLFTITIISSPLKSIYDFQLANMCLSYLSQHTNTLLLHRNDNSFVVLWEVIFLFTQVLDLYFRTSIASLDLHCHTTTTTPGEEKIDKRQHYENSQRYYALLSLGYDMTLQLLDLITITISTTATTNTSTNSASNITNHTKGEKTQTVTIHVINTICEIVLPFYSMNAQNCYNFNFTPVFGRLYTILTIKQSSITSWTYSSPTNDQNQIQSKCLSTMSIFRLVSFVILNPDDDECIPLIQRFIHLLIQTIVMDRHHDVKYTTNFHDSGSRETFDMLWPCLLHILGCIYVNTTTCHDTSCELISLAEEGFALHFHNQNIIQNKPTNSKNVDMHISTSCNHFIELLFSNLNSTTTTTTTIDDELLTLLLSLTSDLDKNQNVSIQDCSDLLLLGLSLFVYSMERYSYHRIVDNKHRMDKNNEDGGSDSDDDFNLVKGVLSYLQQLISPFPHLGRRCLPIIMARINKLTSTPQSNNVKMILLLLDFVCSSLALDATCAFQIWSTFSSIISSISSSESSSSSKDAQIVPCLIIRLFPTLCQANKRLYKRIRDTLGSLVNQASAEIRIATSASLCDLAKGDFIRDVSEVIGWIQSFLGEKEEPIVAHYAILALHYLVVAGELDFDMVIKVLNKRLVKVGSLSDILKLDYVVLQALVILLGDGEEGHDNDEDSDADEKMKEVGVSLQIRQSVSVLIGLAENILSSELIDVTLLSSVYCSLSKYSLLNLGIEDEVIRSSTKYSDEQSDFLDTTNPYHAIMKIVTTGFDYLTLKNKDEDCISNIMKLTEKLVQREEFTLGVSIWSKGSRTSSTETTKTLNASKSIVKVPSNIMAILPNHERISELYYQEPNALNGAAVLFSLNDSEGLSVGQVMDILSDILNDMSDIHLLSPLHRAICFHSWFIGMASLWNIIESEGDESKSESTSHVIKEIVRYKDELDVHPDIVYLALSAFSFAIPDSMSHFIEHIHEVIMKAYNNREFDNNEISCACVGFLAMKNIYCSSFTLAQEKVSIIQKEFERSKDQGAVIFESVYWLGLIVQALSPYNYTAKRHDVSKTIRNILSFLILELNTCFEGSAELFETIGACILKKGKLPGDFILRCKEVKSAELCLRSDKKDLFNSLCLALSVVTPVLLQLDKSIALGLYHITRKITGHEGVYYILTSIYRVCRDANIIDRSETNEFANEVSDLMEKSTATKDTHGLMYLHSSITSNGKDIDMNWWRDVLEIRSSLSTNNRALYVTFFCHIVCSIPAVSCESFFNSPRLWMNVKKSDVNQVIDILNSIANDMSEDESVQSAAIIGLSILTSLKNPISYETRSYQDLQTKSTTTEITEKNSSVNESVLSYIPQACEGTLVSWVLEKITHVMKGNTTESYRLSYLMKCIHEISLPASFIKVLDSLLAMTSEDDMSNLQSTCVEVLVTQLSMLRRNASDRRQYVRQSITLARLPYSSFMASLGPGANEFMQSIHEMIPQWEGQMTVEIVDTLWTLCVNNYSQGNQVSGGLMSSFLKSILKLLEKPTSKKDLSPIALTGLYKSILVTIFDSLCDTIECPGVCTLPSNIQRERNEIWTYYFQCLHHIPLNAFYEYNFFSFLDSGTWRNSHNISRLYAIAWVGKSASSPERYDQQQLKSIMNEVLKAQLWVAKQSAEPNEKISPCYSALWQAIYYLSATMNVFKQVSIRTELVDTLFQVLAIYDPTHSLCVDVLSTQVCLWNSSLSPNNTSNILSNAKFYLMNHGEHFHLYTMTTVHKLATLLSNDMCLHFMTVCRDLQLPRYLKILSNVIGQPSYSSDALLKMLFICCKCNHDEDNAHEGAILIELMRRLEIT